VHVSLSRISLWLISTGVFDQEYATAVAGTGAEHAYVVPQSADARGFYKGVTEQVRMSETPRSYRHILVPRGSSRPEWLLTVA
jgi:hypothetical protein